MHKHVAITSTAHRVYYDPERILYIVLFLQELLLRNEIVIYFPLYRQWLFLKANDSRRCVP